MYELYSKWSLPTTYMIGNPAELVEDKIPQMTAFRFVEGEYVEYSERPYHQLTDGQVMYSISPLDRELITRVAMSKYVTEKQLYEYMHLQGRKEYRNQIAQHLKKLVNLRVLQECCLRRPEDTSALSGIPCFRLDYWGRIIALEENVPFHTGNVYVSKGKKKRDELKEDTALEIKRILAANRIMLGLLKSEVSMERFGFVETFRPLENRRYPSSDSKAPIMRVPLNVAIDLSLVFAYEVVRDCQEELERLGNKMKRYYSLEASIEYLMDNVHGYEDAPQLIICGESWEHNLRIKKYLKERNLWDFKIPIYFTEDLLNLQDSNQSVYEITESKEKKWYEMKTVKKISAA